MTDHYTDELFDITNAEKVIFPVSRLVVDPERFADDKLESMAKIGLGVVYTHTSSLIKLRNTITAEQKQSLLDNYYYPHHQNLETACQNALNKHANCILFDCHSFPSQPLPYELKTSNSHQRPEICIVTDSFHTSKQLEETLYSLFKQKGYDVAINTPFAGSLVPLKFYQQDNRVQSVMFEIRRDLYMNEQTGEKTANFNKVKLDIAEIIHDCHSIIF